MGPASSSNCCLRDATFENIPKAPADVSFSTSFINFSSFGTVDNSGNPTQDFTIGSFLSSLSAVPPSHQTYSSIVNPLLGGVPSSSTPLLSCGGNTCQWLSFFEITGDIFLRTGQQIAIAHDDGVSLKLLGDVQSGLTFSNAPSGVETITYSGAPGLVNFDLVYSEGHSAPGFLQLAAVVPEPESITLLGAGLFCLAILRLRRKGRS